MRLQFDILTLFPSMFDNVFSVGIVRRAVEAGLVQIACHDLREFGVGRHRVTDDAPYGGGGGMVMKPEPILAALESVAGLPPADDLTSAAYPAWLESQGIGVTLMTPQGEPLSYAAARRLSHKRRLVVLCGRYEGVDERVREHLVTDEISIGDYVLSGGELPAMVLVEVVTRLLPGALGDPGASFEDSFSAGLLEYPQYTRPAAFRGVSIPPVLVSGNHAEVVAWRRREALRRTFERRPDLLASVALSPSDEEYLASLGRSSDEKDRPGSEFCER
jgi:tRNA (guanine37-N1)-methyltransferase